MVAITGASRGLGREFARACAREGATVALMARDKAGVAEAADDIQGETYPVICDVTEPDSMTAAFDEIATALGGVDAVVANAGVTLDTSRAQNLSVETWQQTLEVNLTGAFITAQTAHRHLQNSNSGRMVLVSSVMARTPRRGVSAYAASKAGIEGLTRALAVDWARDGISVNAISPGFIAAGMGAVLGMSELPPAIEKLREALTSKVPLRRVGDAEEVADLVAFLVGPRVGYLTGQVISIDGGYGLD
ncbi:SDR family NAD(P)-dependent oxidoreductase [Nocardia sp. NPDC046473]|uniref:SDR family NAD(P)-dependent oxidoreductase n=1 Tax=Nocardia sp. NPDC046473 TaxID=3155733 RepID=UPI003400C30C